MALREHRRPLGVEPGRDEHRVEVERARVEVGRVVVGRDRVEVDDAEERVALLLGGGVLAEAADQVAEVFLAGRLDAGEDAHWKSFRSRSRPGALALPAAGIGLAWLAQVRQNKREEVERGHRPPFLAVSRRSVKTRATTLVAMAVTDSTWTPSSWHEFPALQQPEWPDPAALEAVRERLGRLPSLIFAGEARALRHQLGEAAEGRAFLLQAGDCAESFHELSVIAVRERLKLLLQMSAVMTYGATLPVIKVGRLAGQFAKPRSSATEVIDGVELPSFRGHAVHSDEPTVEARTPDPERLVQAYYQAVSSLNLLRAFTKGGFADLTQVHTWNQEFVASSLEGRRYEVIANEIGRALRFMQAIGIDLGDERSIHEVDVWTSHEALLLDYEEPLVRKDSTTGDWYACSAHFLWVGERTRQLDGAHVEFLSGLHNPVGAKVGPTMTPDELVALAERLNPDRVARAADAHHPPRREPRAGAPAAAAAGGARGGDPRRLGLRPDARERLRHRLRAQDPPARRRAARDRGVLRRPPRGRAPGPEASISRSPART